MKRNKSKRNQLKRGVAMVSLISLALCIGIGGTYAWLTDKTGSITNTFTVGDINITLAETTTDYKMVPSADIAKDPKVTVLENSEDCWLFVKIEEGNSLASYVSYTVANGWTALEGETGVYYREVSLSTSDQPFDVLADNEVHVLESVTKEMVEAITEGNEPTLTFTSYAVQKTGFATAALAWAEASA